MNCTLDDLQNQQQNLDNDAEQKNITDQSDCNTSFQEIRQTELPDNEQNFRRNGKKNTIHQYYKIRTDRYLNELKQKQTQKDASSQIFPDSANDSFQVSNQDNSYINQTTGEQFKRNDQRKPSTKQYYQKKVLGMIQDMSKRAQIKQANKESFTDIEQDTQNFNEQRNDELYTCYQEKMKQKHLEILEKQKQQAKIQKELAQHQDQLVNKYHFLFKKGISSGISKSASSGKITDTQRSFYSEEKNKIQSHQSSLVFHESSFKKFQEDKEQLLQRHKKYVEQMKKLEKEINSSCDKQNPIIQVNEPQDQIFSNNVVNEQENQKVSPFQFDEIQEIQQSNQNEQPTAVSSKIEDDMIQTKEEQKYDSFKQEQQENQVQLTQVSEEKNTRIWHPISEIDLQSSDFQFQENELKQKTKQKVSALKGNRRNQSQQRIAQGEKSVQFPFQEELTEKEKKKDLIFDSEEGIKLDLSKLGAINRKEMKKKRAETQSANSKRSIRSNWSTKTFKEKAEEVAGPAFGTALIGSLGVAITNKVLRGKQKLLGIVPALAVGAYFYYKATKENEVEDDGYEEDIDDYSDDEDEVISTNK